MKKMNTYIKNMVLTYPIVSIFILLVIPIFVYIIVLIIDISYDFPLDTVLNWESSLNYFGTVYGSLLGFLGVIITILYTQNQVKKQKKEADLVRLSDNALAVMPYMHIKSVESYSFPNDKNLGLNLHAQVGTEYNETAYMDFIITNKGRGAVTELYLFTKNHSDTEYNQLISDDQTSTDFIDIGESQKLRIEINYSSIDSDKKYPFLKVRFEYNDVFFNTYKENHTFYFEIDNSNFKDSWSSLRSKHVYDPKGNLLQIGIDSMDRIPIV